MTAFRHYWGHSAVAALAGIATLALVIGARSWSPDLDGRRLFCWHIWSSPDPEWV